MKPSEGRSCRFRRKKKLLAEMDDRTPHRPPPSLFWGACHSLPVREPRTNNLQPGVDRLALQGEHPEYAFVHPIQRLAPHKSLERLDAQCEFSKRQRPLDRETSRSQPVEVPRRRVLRSVDDAKVLRSAALQRWLDEAATPASDEVVRLDDDTFRA